MKKTQFSAKFHENHQKKMNYQKYIAFEKVSKFILLIMGTLIDA